MHIFQVILGLLALIAFSLAAFEVQFSQGVRTNWTAVGLALVTVAWLLPA